MISIQRVTYLVGSEASIRRTFSEREIETSETVPNKAKYFTSHFAAKEADFKALAHFTKDERFDMRIFESLRDEGGFPYIIINRSYTA